MASAVHHCKDCGLYFESSKSLDVHLHYHKDNLLSKWATQAQVAPPPPHQAPSQQQHEAGEHNNNTCGTLNHNKGGRQRENEASMKPSGRPPSAPSTSYPQPPTPNGTSPLYSPVENRFSPGFNYGDASSSNGPSSAFSPVPAASSPASMLPPPDMRSPPNTANGYYPMDDGAAYAESQYTNGGAVRSGTPSGLQSPSSTSGPGPGPHFRYQPYNGGVGQYQGQGGYGPSQCERCGCICESPPALMEHAAVCPQQQHQQHQRSSRASPAAVVSSTSHFIEPNMFEGHAPMPGRIKQEHEPAEILDLDSHKVHVYEPPADGKGRLPPPPFSCTSQSQAPPPVPPVPVALVANIHALQPPHHERPPTEPDNRFAAAGMHPMYHEMHGAGNLIPPSVPPVVQQALPPSSLPPSSSQFLQQHPHPHSHPLQMHHQVPASSVPPPPPPAINSGAGPPPGSAPSSGNQSWKSNEARRPKTYNCSACNKWFTSSGHLKRHYNTTLHKNAVKQGAPDPAKESSSHRASAATGDSLSSTTTPSPAPSLGEESSSRSDDNSTSFGRTTPATAMLPLNASAGSPNRQAGLLEAPTLAALGGTTPGGLQLPPSHPPFTLSSSNKPTSSPINSISPSIMVSSSPGPPHHPSSVAPHPTLHMLGPHQQHQGLRGMLSGHAMHPAPALTTPTSTTNGAFDPFELHNGSLPPPLGQHHHHHQTYAPLTPLPSFAQFHHFGADPGVAMLPPFSTMHAPYPGFLVAEHQQWMPLLAHSPAASHSDSSNSTGMEMSENEIKEESPAPPPPPPVVVAAPPPRSGRGSRGSRGGRGRGGGVTRNTPSRTPNQTVSSSILSNGVPTTIHKCLDCDKLFNKACYLTQHNKSFHSGDKPFKCNTCGKRFTADYLYQEHLGKHAGDKPYKCEICPKQFNHKTDLRRHMCLHTGEKPYACEVCGKGFIRKDHMLKHCETHRRKMSNNNNHAN